MNKSPSPLRQHFIRELTLRGFSERTIESYVAWVYDLARYHHRSPDQLSDEELKAHLLHLHEARQLSFSTIRQAVYAIRSFYILVLGRPEAQMKSVLVPPRMEVRRPDVFSLREIQQLLREGAVDLRDQAFLATVYAAGLRLNEACHLRVENICKDRKQIRVEQGKGRKDRYTLLPEGLLKLLERYQRVFQPAHWLFPRRRQPDLPMLDSTAQQIYYRALRRARLPRRGGIHALRHAFATHTLETGVEVTVVQRLLGHRSLKTTANYLHVRAERMAQIRSPLDLIDLDPMQPC